MTSQLGYRATRIGLILLSAIGVSVSNEALAQGTSSVGNPALLAAIQKLQTDLQAQLNSLTTTVNSLTTTVNSLTTSVTNIQDSIDSVTATTDSNVRVTAPIPLVDDDTLLCAATNISATSKEITLEMIRDGGQIMASFTAPVPSLLATAASKAVGAGGFFLCRFTVLDGTRSDIRGMGRSNINLLPFIAE